MENNDNKKQEQSKIVNLCEDMNPHIHNEASYKKLKDLEKSSENNKNLEKNKK